MLHKISDFCNKIDSIKKMSDELRRIKYNTPKTKARDMNINNLIEAIQSDCLLVANDKTKYDNDDKGEYGDYSGISLDTVDTMYDKG